MLETIDKVKLVNFVKAINTCIDYNIITSHSIFRIIMFILAARSGGQWYIGYKL
jgi:hypothetical protein